jgi:uncharacterized SAM-binding protein YcdF (DUF218 family)
MTYLLSKILTQLVYPLATSGLLIALGGLLLAARRRALGGMLFATGLAWLWICSMPVFSNFLQGSLEECFQAVAVESMPKVDAVVVLGGGVQGVGSRRVYPDLTSAADRVWHAARLYHAGRASRIVITGGNQPFGAKETPEAEAVVKLLSDLGVPEDVLLWEGGSRNTRENALGARKLLQGGGLKSVLLVTSASHMRRALATFRASGIDALPAPTDFSVGTQAELTLLDFLPDAEALVGSSRAIKEYLGLFVYQWRGWAVNDAPCPGSPRHAKVLTRTQIDI